MSRIKSRKPATLAAAHTANRRNVSRVAPTEDIDELRREGIVSKATASVPIGTGGRFTAIEIAVTNFDDGVPMLYIYWPDGDSREELCVHCSPEMLTAFTAALSNVARIAQ